eukprot:scaffold5342_cov67-Phaeocystis_antarctica.AAC.4
MVVVHLSSQHFEEHISRVLPGSNHSFSGRCATQRRAGSERRQVHQNLPQDVLDFGHYLGGGPVGGRPASWPRARGTRASGGATRAEALRRGAAVSGGGGGGACGRVAAQGGGAAVQRACECSHGRRRWAGGLAWVQLTWLGCGLASRAEMSVRGFAGAIRRISSQTCSTQTDCLTYCKFAQIVAGRSLSGVGGRG